MENHSISIQYEGEVVTIEIIVSDHELSYKVNFEHPIYLKKDIDNDGLEYWLEDNAGRTLRAREIGEQIEQHPDFI